MTLFARLPRRPQLGGIDPNRPLEIVSYQMIKLTHPTNLRLQVSCGTATDMARNAFHPRMGGILRGDKLWIHRFVANLPAETDRLRVVVCLITAQGSHEEKYNAASCEDAKNFAVPWPG